MEDRQTAGEKRHAEAFTQPRGTLWVLLLLLLLLCFLHLALSVDAVDNVKFTTSYTWRREEGF